MQVMFTELDQLPKSPAPCDCHFHVFSAEERSIEARYAPDYAASLTDWENLSQVSGVRRGVVVQPSFLGTDNRQLLATLASRAEELRGVAVVSESVSESELCALHANGVRAVRLNLMGCPDDERAIRDLPSSWWTSLMAAGLHLELHSEIGRISSLLPLIPQCIVVVLDHFAKPQTAHLADATVAAVRARERGGSTTYVTLSGAYRLGATDTLARSTKSKALAALWLDVLGHDHLLWGSDWPCTNYESEADYAYLREQLASWLPDLGDQDAALSSNPDRLYWRE